MSCRGKYCTAQHRNPSCRGKLNDRLIKDVVDTDLESMAKLKAENERLLKIINGTDSDLLEKWIAEDGPEAHAVHLAGVEHEAELRVAELRGVTFSSQAIMNFAIGMLVGTGCALAEIVANVEEQYSAAANAKAAEVAVAMSTPAGVGQCESRELCAKCGGELH